MRRAVIVHPSALLARGLSSLISEKWDVRVTVYTPDGNWMPAIDDENDCYFACASLLAQYPSFFLTRRRRTVIISSEASVSGQLPGEESSFQVIRASDTLKSIQASIENVLSQGATATPPESALSNRELEVLREIASGKSFKEIADSLCISVNTVMSHRKNISSKLGIRSTSGLSVYALMNGIV